jgi:hypothetical protein
VASLEAEHQRAVIAAVEADAEPQQLLDRRRRPFRQNLDRRGTAEPASGGDRVGRVLLGRVA